MYPVLVNTIKKTLDDHKAEDIQIINLKGTNPFTDYYLIATVNNERQLGAIGDYIEEAVEAKGGEVRRKEGSGDSGWVIYDCESVIVHIFLESTRKEIKLEELVNKIIKNK